MARPEDRELVPLKPGFDVVWNPNAYGSAALYPRFAGRVLTGAGCVPLRAGLPTWSDTGTDGTGGSAYNQDGAQAASG